MSCVQSIFAAIILQQIVIETIQQASDADGEQPMWQLSGKYQGDIVLGGVKRSGMTNKNKRWPNAEMPYEISSEFNERQKQLISQTIEKEFGKSCVTVRPRKDTDTDYISITGIAPGCWSAVGRMGGNQKVNLNREECLHKSIIIHEMLHAVGFYHQQSVPERDDYVDIFWNNIDPKFHHEFKKYDANQITSFGEKYDYDSIMHYNRFAYSKGKVTILPKDRNKHIGVSQELSKTDIVKLNKMYNCGCK